METPTVPRRNRGIDKRKKILLEPFQGKMGGVQMSGDGVP